MAMHWASGTDLSVRTIRSQIGMPSDDGAIGFGHMIKAFERYKVQVKSKVVSSANDIQKIIDSGKIALVLIHSGKIRQTKGNIQRNLFDRYYDDAVGHYIIIKGRTLNKEYFIVYDPIPGEWYRNSIRYSDGVSMIGKNRYYSAKQVYEALKTRALLVISQN